MSSLSFVKKQFDGVGGNGFGWKGRFRTGEKLPPSM